MILNQKILPREDYLGLRSYKPFYTCNPMPFNLNSLPNVDIVL